MEPETIDDGNGKQVEIIHNDDGSTTVNFDCPQKPIEESP